MNSLVMSIFIYACKTWKLTAELEIKTFETRNFRKLLGVTYIAIIANEVIKNTISGTLHISTSYHKTKCINMVWSRVPLRRTRLAHSTGKCRMKEILWSA